eukprot:CAMPEP_0204546902 /NCGR_PEP_ID=MMETSP0661-20131031/22389_1 /ASSEMBLY_ACC=CAM_ASM_000606 /TAXON_ID=109239 /ORGANISM="Alexandrium margalefi, Strain AMGDE01CS-322" /LENGTH=84 /DNA_ID=CAMNT_0051553755 /DNA_START=21 /DNA_END=272 /DNA_ORIENTATION=+
MDRHALEIHGGARHSVLQPHWKRVAPPLQSSRVVIGSQSLFWAVEPGGVADPLLAAVEGHSSKSALLGAGEYYARGPWAPRGAA